MNKHLTLLLAAPFGLMATGHASQKPDRPNIMIILADDMGYSDLGCYGGEIQTPNIDKLANTGVRFTQFYNCARCCPSRASLLTGQYPHKVGINGMGVNLNMNAGHHSRSVENQQLPHRNGWKVALVDYQSSS